MKFYKLYSLCIFVGILLIIACKKDKGVINPKEWKAYPINEIKTYSDSSYYFGRIINSTEYNDIIVLNDNKFNRAILYDTSLQFKRIIGGEGKGPKEFGKLSGNPIIDKNYIYLYDLTTNKIKIFKKNGKYYESINYPLPAGEDFIHFDYCKDTNNNFYSSSYLKDKPIIKFSQKGNILNEFGEFIPSINMKHKRVLNYRHTIVTQDNKIITVNIRNPRIKIFSDNGELIAQYNYNNFFDYYIESVNKRIKKSKKNKFKRPILFRDTYYKNNRLYLLYWGHKYGEHPFSSQVAVFLIDNNQLYFEKVINLQTDTGKGSFSTICVLNNKLIAFDVLSGNILVYKI